MDTNETNGEKIAGTNLTTVPEYAKTALVIADLQKRLGGLVYTDAQLDTDAKRKLAKKDVAEVREYRTSLEAERKRIKQPALDRCREIDDEAKRLTADLRAIEDPLKAQIDAVEMRVEAEKAAKALAEQQRQDNHRAAIQRFRDFPLSLQGRPADVIQSKLEAFQANEVIAWEVYDEFADQARDAYGAALGSAREILQRQRDHEAAQEQARKDREVLEQQAREIAEMREREAQRVREDEERKVREREAAEAKERERVQNIRATIENLRDKGIVRVGMSSAELEERWAQHEEFVQQLSYFDFDEFKDEASALYDLNRDYLREKIAEAKRREQQEREEAQRRAEENERMAEQRRQQEAEAERQRIENERLQRERAEHAKEVERQRIANLGLMEAVRAVVDWVEGLMRDGSTVVPCESDLVKVYRARPSDKKADAKPVKKPKTQA
jgi:colicin import membrane protein